DALARLARAHQMHGGSAAGIEPVAGKVERRAIADLESEHVHVKTLAAFEILRLDREMLQSAQRPGLFPCFITSAQTHVRSASAPIIQAPTVSKWLARPCNCWVTVWMSRKRRSSGWVSKIAVAPAAL